MNEINKVLIPFPDRKKITSVLDLYSESHFSVWFMLVRTMAVTEFNPMVRHMLTQEQKLRVKDTVPVLKENGIALRDYLYKRMLRNNPDLQEDFNMGSGAVLWLRSLS